MYLISLLTEGLHILQLPKSRGLAHRMNLFLLKMSTLSSYPHNTFHKQFSRAVRGLQGASNYKQVTPIWWWHTRKKIHFKRNLFMILLLTHTGALVFWTKILKKRLFRSLFFKANEHLWHVWFWPQIPVSSTIRMNYKWLSGPWGYLFPSPASQGSL